MAHSKGDFYGLPARQFSLKAGATIARGDLLYVSADITVSPATTPKNIIGMAIDAAATNAYVGFVREGIVYLTAIGTNIAVAKMVMAATGGIRVYDTAASTSGFIVGLSLEAIATSGVGRVYLNFR